MKNFERNEKGHAVAAAVKREQPFLDKLNNELDKMASRLEEEASVFKDSLENTLGSFTYDKDSGTNEPQIEGSLMSKIQYHSARINNAHSNIEFLNVKLQEIT